MKIIYALFFIFVSLIFPLFSAVGAEIGGKHLNEIANGDVKSAKKLFSGQTIIMRRPPPEGSKANLDLTGMPATGTFVAYIAWGQQIHLWTRDNDKIISGGWDIRMTKGKNPVMIFCVNMSTEPKRVPCMSVKHLHDDVFDSKKGNIFGLREGIDAPAPLPKLKSISAILESIK